MSNPETQLITFSLENNFSKENISSVVNKLSSELSSGDTDIMKTYIKIRAIKEVLSNLENEIKDLVLDEASKYEKGSAIYGVQFDIVNGRRNYNFSYDNEYNRLKQALKERETMLKSLSEPVADAKSGEMIMPAEVTYSSDSIRIKFN